ncbi:Nramp family divalent metal transporter [Tengunoibacter tsumagoiensis]|uniref:Mn transporter n=1 Tax=Tengunoibacter tsumagoiensis TaxID=2014871 RepID=A0A402AAM3_9CHLR|nr:Nramp family divalent metal transporter [Tengunoibacter tsumagoiensis]GCE15981.1 Mn transporter [Tengunoibacter tsumagoiensis]
MKEELQTPIISAPLPAASVTGKLPVVKGRRRSRWLILLGLFGPGLIAASAGNDASGIATYSSMGAQYGFQMLWVMVLLTLGMGIVQEMCTRMGAVTGKGLSDLIRENFPIRLTALVMLTFLLANGGIVISEFVGIVAALNLFHIPSWIGAPCAGIILWWLVARGSYQRVEKVFLALTLVFFAYFIAAFMAQPDWGNVAFGSFVPTIQFNSGFLLTLVAAVGTTISPYMQIYVQSAVVERGVTMRDYNPQRVDVYSSAVFSNIVAAFIIICTSATLFLHSGGKGVVLKDAADAAQALAPFLGPYATYIFALGLLGASFLAAGVLPISTCYSITEALGLENGVSRSWKEAPAFWGLFTTLIVLGVVISMLPNLPVVQILLNLSMLNGIVLPVILFAILYLVNKKSLMGHYTNGPVFNAMAYGLAVIVSLLAIAYLAIQVLGLFGIHLLGS